MSENSLPKCNVCDKKFTSRNKLFKHLEVSCTEELVVKEAKQNGIPVQIKTLDDGILTFPTKAGQTYILTL